MIKFIKSLFDPEKKELARLAEITKLVNAREAELKSLSDDELRAKTEEFRKRLADGQTLDDILPEAFAVVREASVRTLGMRHFDEQVMGGIALHEGKISEMKTGEGKTLAATMPVYLNALEGKGVHVVTVNDYLARRDADWMGAIYRFLGMSVGCILHGQTFEERKKAYACDITYGTNNEYGFDYLRDNMVLRAEDMVQRDLHYAIIDEVDSILIDEARTPLIISGSGEESTELYSKFASIVPRLKHDEDFTIDEKAKTVAITENGVEKVEKILGVENLYDPENIGLTHHLNQALRAQFIMKRDVDYVVKDGEVIIVDEFTGRLMPGRRYSNGLHQAIEAKENVKVAAENRTLASITFQNYFRMYKKLAGMTGTAKTEAEEFLKIYGLRVVEIPTHKPMIRTDYPDVIYKTEVAKYKAVIEEIKEMYAKKRPVLVGTISIERSELLSELLKRAGIPHKVLNAKNHEQEAEIVAQAGRIGAVTISTNMAGRGTDIILGGNPDFLVKERLRKEGLSPEMVSAASEKVPSENLANSLGISVDELKELQSRYEEMLREAKKELEVEHQKVVELGGLHIIGTERHESRRIDNQLRGRAGRQGDPGSSRFYISLEDELMRRFGGDRALGLLEKLGWTEDMPIEHDAISRQIESAQKRVEAWNFNIRKNVLEYDQVLNRQREAIYSLRRGFLLGGQSRQTIDSMIENTVKNLVEYATVDTEQVAQWPWDSILSSFRELIGTYDQGVRDLAAKLQQSHKNSSTRDALEDIVQQFTDEVKKAMAQREEEIGKALFQEISRVVTLRNVDQAWMDHLDNMDDLKEGIGLRAYGQMNPLIEYQKESSRLFEATLMRIEEETIRLLFHLRLANEEEVKRAEAREKAKLSALQSNRNAAEAQAAPVQAKKEPGRNDPCPCGSGKKYKKCCGK
ncbi:MAG: preprotein translocase subunit SecA [Bacillota bacterium]|nr:preprotein translocase subunit SecA [Bacillota bacterium]NLU55440.1 preprotein translocase subunit SecA [Bacillota bacterium]HOA90620.1 preprotein translocase subunit SecA [Bacillota bacterium]HOP54135.1 preprotein translocase subunit SecA [Bacillota bacterium]HPT60131.1 preprotein translocase subunit SecA [Bacillota bacterium]